MPASSTTWAPGKTGNPGGRPRIMAAVRDIARKSTTLAIETLRTLAADQDAPHAARVSAATALLDRGWGKPMQGHTVMAVAAPKSMRELADEELMAMMEKRVTLPHGS